MAIQLMTVMKALIMKMIMFRRVQNKLNLKKPSKVNISLEVENNRTPLMFDKILSILYRSELLKKRIPKK